MEHVGTGILFGIQPLLEQQEYLMCKSQYCCPINFLFIYSVFFSTSDLGRGGLHKYSWGFRTAAHMSGGGRTQLTELYPTDKRT